MIFFACEIRLPARSIISDKPESLGSESPKSRALVHRRDSFRADKEPAVATGG